MGNRFKDYLAGLDLQKMDHLPTYHSPGCEREAKVIGKVANGAYDYLQGFFQEHQELILLVLNECDWENDLEKRASNQATRKNFGNLQTWLQNWK